MTKRKKKSLFDRAIDALTDRDEKEGRAEKAAAEKPAADNVAVDKIAAQKASTERAATIQAAAPRKGVVSVRSLRVRADHNTQSEVVAGLVDGDEVTILGTWSDGRNIWAQLEKGWAAMEYDGETYIKTA
ncbi:MAG TPA: SH3 domain-containing protein [Anaerolineales bacterium]